MRSKLPLRTLSSLQPSCRQLIHVSLWQRRHASWVLFKGGLPWPTSLVGMSTCIPTEERSSSEWMFVDAMVKSLRLQEAQERCGYAEIMRQQNVGVMMKREREERARKINSCKFTFITCWNSQPGSCLRAFSFSLLFSSSPWRSGRQEVPGDIVRLAACWEKYSL